MTEDNYTPSMPTADQCAANALIHETEKSQYYAVQYPSMDMCTGNAVVRILKAREYRTTFDVWVWRVAINGEADGPYEATMLIADHYIGFGNTIHALQEKAIPGDCND